MADSWEVPSVIMVGNSLRINLHDIETRHTTMPVLGCVLVFGLMMSSCFLMITLAGKVFTLHA